MPLPTLLVKGSLSGSNGEKNKDKIPIEYIIDRIKSKMYEYNKIKPSCVDDRIFIIKSETGSGKSTVLPAYIFRLLRDQRSSVQTKLNTAGTICTQPKILTAQTIARDQSDDNDNYPDLTIGVTIGYQTGPFNEKPFSGLIYSTAGILLTQFKMLDDDEITNKYKFIIIDEAHERSLEIDCLILLLKKFMLRNITNPRCPFVMLASATLPVEKYQKFFGIGDDNVIGVTGRAYPIKDFYMKHGTNNYYECATEIAKKIHEEHPDDHPDQADILVFLPGMAEITKVYTALTKLNLEYMKPGSKFRPFKLLKIDGQAIKTQSLDYQLIKTEDRKLLRLICTDGKTLIDPIRRITLSTIVAETGLTIETLKYVIDCGWDRTSETYYPGNYSGLLTRPAPRSKIKQRKGRCGRLFPGEFYPLYTHNVYKSLAEEQLPSIITDGIESVFLSVAHSIMDNKTNVFDLADIDMLDMPSSESMVDTLKKCLKFGYISRCREEAATAGVAARLDSAVPAERLSLRENLDQGSEKYLVVDKAPPAKAKYTLTDLGDTVRKMRFLDFQQAQTILAGYTNGVSIQDLAFIVALYHEAEVILYEKEPMKNFTDPNYKFKEMALKASIPHYLVNVDSTKYKMDSAFRPAAIAAADKVSGGVEYTPMPSGDEPFFRTKLLISDDFIEALLVFSRFTIELENVNGDIEKLSKWCMAHGINMEGAIMLAGMRDEIISELVTAGLNPYYNSQHRLSETPPELFLTRIIGLKKCIYAGLQYNIIRGKKGVYTTPTRDSINISPMFSKDQFAKIANYGMDDYMPNAVVTNKIIIAKVPMRSADKFPPLLYRLVPGLVSIMDGYVL